jgi:hypothetical protein
MLVGYPVTGRAGLEPGALYATFPADYTFDPVYQAVYGTTGFRSFPGNSGGPVCVNVAFATATNFYPAAIYLGGSGQSVVRLIDQAVVDLISRADLSANTGDNNLGGGAIQQDTPLSGTGVLQAGWAQIVLTPPEAVAAGARWNIVGRPGQFESGQALGLRPASYVAEFSPVAGFLTPSSVNLNVSNAVTLVLTVPYTPTGGGPQFGSLTLLQDGRMEWDLAGLPNAAYVIEETTNIVAGWRALVTNTVPANGVWRYTTPPITGQGSKYYRARTP